MRFFHISHKDLGERVKLIAKVPDSRNNAECRITPRVCFSPTIWQSLVGKQGTKVYRHLVRDLLHTHRKARTQPVVYETRKKLVSPPHTVSDFAFTGEAWSYVSIEVRRVGYVDLKYLMLHGVPRTTKNARLTASDDFIQGWLAGSERSTVNWSEKPPI